MKPFSDSCERNQQPILDVLVAEFSEYTTVLEIGSGTGQHAAFFAPRLRQLTWQTSDLAENHAGIRSWIGEVEEIGLPEPLELDVSSEHWPETGADAVFSANTAHIMHWDMVCAMMAGVGRQLAPLDGGGIARRRLPYELRGGNDNFCAAAQRVVSDEARDPRGHGRDVRQSRMGNGDRPD